LIIVVLLSCIVVAVLVALIFVVLILLVVNVLIFGVLIVLVVLVGCVVVSVLVSMVVILILLRLVCRVVIITFVRIFVRLCIGRLFGWRLFLFTFREECLLLLLRSPVDLWLHSKGHVVEVSIIKHRWQLLLRWLLRLLLHPLFLSFAFSFKLI